MPPYFEFGVFYAVVRSWACISVPINANTIPTDGLVTQGARTAQLTLNFTTPTLHEIVQVELLQVGVRNKVLFLVISLTLHCIYFARIVIY